MEALEERARTKSNAHSDQPAESSTPTKAPSKEEKPLDKSPDASMDVMDGQPEGTTVEEGAAAPSTPPPSWADEAYDSEELLRDGPVPVHAEDVDFDDDQDTEHQVAGDDDMSGPELEEGMNVDSIIHGMNQIMNIIQALGVGPIEANRFAMSTLKSDHPLSWKSLVAEALCKQPTPRGAT